MKKLISFVLWAFLALGIFGFSFSDSILDYLDNIGWDFLFWYSISENKNISIDSINSSSVTIKSPVLKDEFNDIINNYIITYGEHSLEEITGKPSLLDLNKEKAFSNLSLWGKSSFDMSLTTSDNINPNAIYYVLSVPKDSAGTLWSVSNEMCFRLKDQLVGEGDDCANWVTNANHWAWADMSLANISHTINWNNITLRWIAVSGSDKIDIFLWNEDVATFSKLSTVNMSAESYSFTVSKNGEHIVKFIPNLGKEINYTFNVLWLVDWSKPVPVNPVVTPVVVWPKENLIAVLIWTLILYLAYRLIKRKA